MKGKRKNLLTHRPAPFFIAGFQAFLQKNIEVTVNGDIRLDVGLGLGALTEHGSTARCSAPPDPVASSARLAGQ